MVVQPRDKYSTYEWYEKPAELGEQLQSPSGTKTSMNLEHWRALPNFLRDNDILPAATFRIFRKVSHAQSGQGETIERRFHRLATQWREETFHLSSLTKLVMHPAYQSIIGMGPAVLPVLFRELQENPDHWFWALKAITEQDPTRPEDAGNLQKMTAAWLQWAKEEGYM